MGRQPKPAEPTAPSGGDRTAEAAKQGSIGSFAWKSVWAAVGGAILTVVVGLTQAWYSDRLESRHRQDEHGVEFQNRLALATGRIENEFNDIVDLAKEGGNASLAEALRRVDGSLNDLFRQWRLVRLDLRSRASQVYGSDVGNLVYDPEEESFELDGCYVTVRIGDRIANHNCSARRRLEERRLRLLTRAIRLRPSEPLLRRAGWTPASFQANARLTRKVVERYVRCKASEGAVSPSVWNRQCPDLDDMEGIVIARLDLVAISREEISSAIIATSRAEALGLFEGMFD